MARNRFDDRADIFPGMTGLEKVWRPLWDRQTYVAASPTQRLAFFASAPANVSRGNIKTPGTIPAGHGQTITGVAVMMHVVQFAAAGAATNPLNNMHLLADTGVLTLKIANKEVFELPLYSVLGGSGLAASIGYAGAEVANEVFALGGSGVPHAGNRMFLETPVAIPPQQPFNVQIVWPANVTITVDTDLTVIFYGAEYRPKL